MGPGQVALLLYSAPVMCRHDVQWQREAWRGSWEGRIGVVKVWDLQRQVDFRGMVEDIVGG